MFNQRKEKLAIMNKIADGFEQSQRTNEQLIESFNQIITTLNNQKAAEGNENRKLLKEIAETANLNRQAVMEAVSRTIKEKQEIDLTENTQRNEVLTKVLQNIDVSQKNAEQFLNSINNYLIAVSEKAPKELTDDDKILRAAYALNLCTVSISQIVDYADLNILEQEYEAILNNLNLENIPKDEALLNILKQILDTVTFFRIQEGDKKIIEKEYQAKMKNALWSSAPNLVFAITAGDPAAIAVSLATQVGIGYMNYRKNKAQYTLEQEKEMWKLQRAAIEQFNGLRRELFDTSWRLANTYKFPDEYRLTERQIKQYNEILMDSDEIRRFERLKSIEANFKAYPNFHYFYANTAHSIIENANNNISQEESEIYKAVAKEQYDNYIEFITKNDILREDQITSSCALEYIDLLKQEVDLLDKKNDEDRTQIEDINKKIDKLLEIAIKKSGNANDVLQLCAISYLKLGKIDNAKGLLEHLVNESYNTVMNAKILSAIYVSEIISESKSLDLDKKQISSATSYNILKSRVDSMYLMPTPEELEHLRLNDGANKFPIRLYNKSQRENVFERCQNQFFDNQEQVIRKKFKLIIDEFKKKYTIKYNRTINKLRDTDFDDYFLDEPNAIKQRFEDLENIFKKKGKAVTYISNLKGSEFNMESFKVITKMYNDILRLNLLINNDEKAKILQGSITRQIEGNGEKMESIANSIYEFDTQNAQKGDLKKFLEEIKWYLENVTFTLLTDEFFDQLNCILVEYLKNAKKAEKNGISLLEDLDENLYNFCLYNNFKDPDTMYIDNKKIQKKTQVINSDFDAVQVLSEKFKTIQEKRERQKLITEMRNRIKSYGEKIINENQSGDNEVQLDIFDRFEENSEHGVELAEIKVNNHILSFYEKGIKIENKIENKVTGTLNKIPFLDLDMGFKEYDGIDRYDLRDKNKKKLQGINFSELGELLKELDSYQWQNNENETSKTKSDETQNDEIKTE